MPTDANQYTIRVDQNMGKWGSFFGRLTNTDYTNTAVGNTTPLGDVFFPTALRPLKADLLSRVSWQLRGRAGVEVYAHLPVDPAAAAVGAARVPALYADMARYTVTDGITFDLEVAMGKIIFKEK